MPLDVRTPLPMALPSRSRVLVVDDEPGIRLLVRLMLERTGYSVEEAATAKEAVARVRAADRPFATILLDLSLPDRIGTAVLPELRRAAPLSWVVLTSGKLESEVPNHGADGFLPKPFSMDELIGAVRGAAAPEPV
jgi:CheY-like chemotaxis protein